MLTRILLIGIATLATSVSAAAATDRPLVVRVDGRDGACRYEVANSSVTLEQLRRIARRWSSTSRRAIVVAPANLGYRCVGGAMFTLERNGMTSLQRVADGRSN